MRTYCKQPVFDLETIAGGRRTLLFSKIFRLPTSHFMSFSLMGKIRTVIILNSTGSP